MKTCTLDVSCRAYEGGPVIPVYLENVPIDENEAIKMGLGRAMYDGWIRSETIAKQNKARIAAKRSTEPTATRSKRGSAVNQAAAARAAAMREAAEAARLEAEAQTEEQIAS